jgi:hypothetical protein
MKVEDKKLSLCLTKHYAKKTRGEWIYGIDPHISHLGASWK